MSQPTLEYLKQLTAIASPTGFTDQIIQYLQNELQSMGYVVKKSNKGGLIVTVIGENQTQHRFVTAHVDTLGANTGRMTHNKPNITQCPKTKEFRELLCASPNKVFTM